MNDVYYGANTTLVIYDQGSAEEPLIIGNGDGTAISSTEIYRSHVQINLMTDVLYMGNSHVQVNAAVRDLSVNDQRNEAGLYSDVTINNKVRNLWINNRTQKNTSVCTGTTGSIDNGILYVPLFAERETGPIGANTQIYANGQMLLMSRRYGDTLEAILPTNTEMDTAAGCSGDYFATADIQEDKLYQTDIDAVAALTTSAEWDTSLVRANAAFRIALKKGWIDENGYTNDEGEINGQLNGTIMIRIQNPVDGNSRIVKIQDDGTAVPMETTQENQTLTFSANGAGRYVIVSDTAMPRRLDGSSSELYWYIGLSTEEPEEYGVYGTDRIGTFYIESDEWVEGAGDPVWSVAPVDENAPDCFRTVSMYDDPYYAGLQFKEGAVLIAGDQVYRVQADYNGTSYYKDVTVHIITTAQTGMDVQIAQVNPETQSIGEWQVISSPQDLITGNTYAIRLPQQDPAKTNWAGPTTPIAGIPCCIPKTNGNTRMTKGTTC